jgi:hypothetical protein
MATQRQADSDVRFGFFSFHSQSHAFITEDPGLGLEVITSQRSLSTTDKLFGHRLRGIARNLLGGPALPGREKNSTRESERSGCVSAEAYTYYVVPPGIDLQN